MELQSLVIKICVYDNRRLRSDQMLGSYELDATDIYFQY